MILDKEHRFQLTHNRISHRVYFNGEGPAVVLMHELPGMTPACLAVAQRIVDCGFKVYLPLFFGEPNDTLPPVAWPAALFCIRHEFNLLTSDGASPIADWLRELCRRANCETLNRGVGVIGMCLTGNVVLSVMLEPCVRVPVLCEPSLPFTHKSALGVPQADLDKATCIALRSPILAYRFATDNKCPQQRFDTLCKVFGKGVHATTLPTGAGALPYLIPDGSHSVLTGDYPGQEDPNHPVYHVLDEILGRMRKSLV